MRLAQEHILLVGDTDRQIHGALVQAVPSAQVTAVATYFDAIAELAGGAYTTVLAAAEPIERRPEAAVRTLRQVAGDARILLIGHPTLEPLTRKMLEFGCDDYLIAPASAAELQQMLGTAPLRLATASTDAPAENSEPAVTTPPTRIALLLGLPLVEILLESLVQHPHDAPAAAVKRISEQIAPTMQLIYQPLAQPAPAAPEGMACISHTVRTHQEDAGTLHLLLPRDEDEAAARHFVSQLAHQLGKIALLQDRHNRLQKLAITDELTGLYNGRYFRHFLTRIVDRARVMRFPVTLLLFDIDNFKNYNDHFGHGVGDEILRQTAQLMRRCVRDHDLVARISGDEFAVVFWEKDGPRQPRDPKSAGTPSRPPQTPLEIFRRFQRLMATQDFKGLGAGGQGKLTISGGLAIFPYDAHDVPSLIQAADEALMFGAKQSGKNSIVLVGGDEPILPPDEAKP